MGCICAKFFAIRVVEGVPVSTQTDEIRIETGDVGEMDIDDVISKVRNLQWMTRGHISSDESDEVFQLPNRYRIRRSPAWNAVVAEILFKVAKVDPDPEDRSAYSHSPPPMPDVIPEDEEDEDRTDADGEDDDDVFLLR